MIMFRTQALLVLASIWRMGKKELPLSSFIPPSWPENIPFISIIIPCYNHGKYVREAVESIYKQTWQNFEIIIVNDGSTDEDTNQVLRNIAYQKTRVIHLPSNRGLPAARNIGIQEAQGKYICCLDADDKLQETYLEKAISVMELNAGISIVWAWTQVFGSEDRVWYAPQFDPERILFQNLLNPPGVFRRIAWEKAGGFLESMQDGFEDWEYWIRLTGHGFRGHCISEKLIQYRRVGYSFAQRAAEKQQALFEKIKSYNSTLYTDPKTTMAAIKRKYRDLYNPNPFVNMKSHSYRRIPNLSGVFLSNLDSRETIKWLKHNKTISSSIWISHCAMDEQALNDLYERTPFVYILPNFIPQYARWEFVQHIQRVFERPPLIVLKRPN